MAKANPLRNVKKAAILLPMLDRLAPNVGMFTGHAAQQHECLAHLDDFVAACKRNGMAVQKTASVSDGGREFVARALEKSAAAGDAIRTELLAEALVALDAAAELELYADSRGTHKVAQLGEAGTALAGAALGAVVGGGAKYLLSDPAERKRGLGRLADAALVGAAAGGLGGYMLGDSVGPSGDIDPRHGAEVYGRVKDFGGMVSKKFEVGRNASERQLAENADIVDSGDFKTLSPGGSPGLFSTRHGAGAQHLAWAQQNATTLSKQMLAMEAGLRQAKAKGDGDAADVLAGRIRDTRKVLTKLNRNINGGYEWFHNAPDSSVGRDIEHNRPAGFLSGLATVPANTLYTVGKAFGYRSDSPAASADRGRDHAGEIHTALRAAMDTVAANSRVFGLGQ